MGLSEALERRVENDGDQFQEISTARAAEAARAEIESAILIALKFKRNENQARQDLLNSCKRVGFAEKAMYSFPRFDKEAGERKDITGPSVNLAREAARLWGNIRWGFVVIADSETQRSIEGYAFDMQTNIRVSEQATFKKEGWLGKGKWGVLNERGIRELTSRMAAFAIRNSLLQVIPKDLTDEAMETVEDTLRDETTKDPKAAKNKVMDSFNDIGVPVGELEKLLKHSMDTVSPAELTRLRKIYKSIDDGQSVWADYLKQADEPQPEKAKKTAAPAASTNETSASAPADSQPAKPAAEPQQPGRVTDADKGLVWQLARSKKWAKATGTADDPLHKFLKKTYGIDSVTQIKVDDLKPILITLDGGPKKSGYEPVS